MRLFLITYLLLTNANAQITHWIGANMPLFPQDVKCLYTDTVNNCLYASGVIYNTPGSVNSESICRYKNGDWTTIGSFNGVVYSLLIFNNELVVSGAFNDINGLIIKNIARYDSTLNNWQSFGNFNAGIKNIKSVNGELYSMGVFTEVDSIQIYGIAKWNGTQWVSVNNFPYMNGMSVDDISVYNAEIYVAGNFYDSTLGIEDMAYFHSGSWQKVGQGFSGAFNGISQLEIYKGELYASGLIQKLDGNLGNGIQKWDGHSWSEVGTSLQDINNSFNGIVQLNDMKIYNNDLYVSGAFYYAGHVPAKAVAKWNGIQWCSLGTSNEFTMLATSIGFYQDTLYLYGGIDSINHVFTNDLIKWTGGNFVDTCSFNLSIDEFRNLYNINIYPNPLKDNLQLQSIKINIDKIQITNIFGKEIYSKEILGAFCQLDISFLTAGIYFLIIETKEGRVVKKFIKE